MRGHGVRCPMYWMRTTTTSAPSARRAWTKPWPRLAQARRRLSTISATDSSSTGVKAGGGGAAGKGGGGALAKVRSFVIRVLPTGTATGLSPATTESWVTPKTGFTGSSVVGIGFTSWLDMGGGGLMCSTSLRTTVRGLGSGCGGGSSGGGGSAGLGGTTSTSTVDGRSLRRPCWGTSTSPKATSACSAMATVAPHRGACACLPTDEALFVNRTLLANAP